MTHLLILTGKINGVKGKILIDSGADASFINKKHASLGASMPQGQGILIQVADKRKFVGREYDKIRLKIENNGTNYEQEISAISAPIAYDLILGKDWLDRNNPKIDWPSNTIHIGNHEWKCSPPKPIIEHISMHTLRRIIKKGKGGVECGIIILNALNETTTKTTEEQDQADKAAIENLPKEVQRLIDKYKNTVFAKFEGLPPSRPQDHRIDLIDENAKPPSRPLYPMAPSELEALQEELAHLAKHRRIQTSNSNFGAPVFYVKQKGKLRLVIDYRGVNQNTVKVMATIPNIQELFDRLTKAKYFTKFDLASGYHQIRIRESDTHKTAFKTKYGLFEWTVMPFGLCNAPATFQSMVNAIFSDMIDHFLIVYLDDILVYSETMEEHLEHIEKVLQRLQDNQLHCRVTKCEFLKQELEYLGYYIKEQHVSILPSRVQSIQDFEIPKSWTDLRSFCGLANTIHRFVAHHAHILAPLTELFKGHNKQNSPPFIFTDEDKKNLEEVKKQLSSPTMLALFDPTKPVHLYTDWSSTGIGSYVAQPDKDGIEHPIAYGSRKCNKAESEYHPYMAEILALVEALRTHRHYLPGNNVKVFTDHRSLQHNLDQPKLRPVQQRWLADLLSYDFEIQWKPGKLNTVADALSRRQYTKDAANDPHVELNNLTEANNEIVFEIKDMVPDDPFFKEITQYLIDPMKPEGQQYPRSIPWPLRTQVSRYRLRDNLLFFFLE
jgi:hypothetical protein